MIVIIIIITTGIRYFPKCFFRIFRVVTFRKLTHRRSLDSSLGKNAYWHWPYVSKTITTLTWEWSNNDNVQYLLRTPKESYSSQPSIRSIMENCAFFKVNQSRWTSDFTFLNVASNLGYPHPRLRLPKSHFSLY